MHMLASPDAIHHTSMTANGRRTTRQSADLEHVHLFKLLLQAAQPFAHQLPYCYIISTNKSRPLIATHSSVCYHHGNTCLKRTRHCGLHLFGFVGTHYQQIYPFADKRINLHALQFAIVHCLTYTELHLRLEYQLALHFLIHLGAPSIVGALAYTYYIHGLFCALGTGA